MNEGVDVYNNVFDQYRDSSVITGCAGEYTDIIHTSSGTHRIYNNKFIIRRVENGGNGMIFIEVFGAIGGGRTLPTGATSGSTTTNSSTPTRTIRGTGTFRASC